MSAPGHEQRVEALAAEFHDLYQAEARRQGDVRHADLYEDLPENVKEFDRVLARRVLSLLEEAEGHARDLADFLSGYFGAMHAAIHPLIPWEGCAYSPCDAVREEIARAGFHLDEEREIVHGTYAGYQAHTRREEPPCEACRDARRDYSLKHLRREIAVAKTSTPAAVGDPAVSGSAAVHSGEGEAVPHAADPGPERPPGDDTFDPVLAIDRDHADEMRALAEPSEPDPDGAVLLARGRNTFRHPGLGDFSVEVDLLLSRAPDSNQVELLVRARLA